MTTPTQLKTDGIDAVLAADCAPHRDYAPLVRAAIEAHRGTTFTSDDAHGWIEARYPDARPHHPSVLSAVFGGAAASGQIVAVGMTRSTRLSGRARRVLVWQHTPTP